MSIFKWIKTFYKASDSAAQRHLNYQALAHLDDHLLRDIGLYIDQGEVRTLSGQPNCRSEPSIEHEYCPYCGSSLT